MANGKIHHHRGKQGRSEFAVWAEDGDYRGPTARVTYDDTWFFVCTDDYEGNAMLNIEALPMLIRALAAIAEEAGISVKVSVGK